MDVKTHVVERDGPAMGRRSGAPSSRGRLASRTPPGDPAAHLGKVGVQMSLRAVVAVIAVLVFSWLMAAESRAGVTRPIRFAPGTSSGVVAGGVIRGERDIYTLKARAGQQMEVRITSVEDNAVFQIVQPGAGQNALPGAGDGEDAKTWKGRLPATGEYRIVVGGTRGNCSYKLTVTIK